MKIALAAPLFESVPPPLYGGTERVVAWITDELVERGHKVTLFASGDSHTRADLVPCSDRALRANKSADPVKSYIRLLGRIVESADSFDLIHSHIDYWLFPLVDLLAVPIVTTCHARLDLAESAQMYSEFPRAKLVSVSDAQRSGLPWADWQRTIYPGLPERLYQPSYDKGDYLLFLGRLSEEKGLTEAVAISREANVPLIIAGKVDTADSEFFKRTVVPLLDLSGIRYVGEVDDRMKSELLRQCRALILPVLVPEPFPLVAIEALACGAPVIASNLGSMREIIQQGENGFCGGSLEEILSAVRHVGEIDRRRCRQSFDQRFTTSVEVDGYLELFENLTGLSQEADRTAGANRNF
jgi:glycosyltransferase involved in cell wall biosynthesis